MCNQINSPSFSSSSSYLHRVHCRSRKSAEEEIRVKIEEDMKQESDRREKEERERYPLSRLF